MSIEKTKQALLEAAANHVEGKPVDPVAKSVIEAMTAIKWSKAPEGSKCLGCGKETLERSRTLMGGPWSGHVRCTACDYHDTLASYLGKTMITVEPLPPGMDQTFDPAQDRGESEKSG